MHTYSALTTLDAREPAEALAEAMENFLPVPTAIGVFEIEDGSGQYEVGAYFEEEPDGTELALMAAIYGARGFVVSEVPEKDWVAHVRRELKPVEAGRFFLYGSHDADKVPPGRIPILIEAAMAFGTGHHATTLGCLRAFDRMLTAGVPPGRVADIGCGTAALAMAAASVWSGTILASDIDPVAVEVAAANVAANGLAGRVTCVEAAGFGHRVISRGMPYDLVFANILKGPLVDLAPDMAQAIAPGGRAILSGILNTQADEVVAAYARDGFILENRDEIAEWTILVLRRGQSPTVA
jgi:ribosomal protein L11 methyltransferase